MRARPPKLGASISAIALAAACSTGEVGGDPGARGAGGARTTSGTSTGSTAWVPDPPPGAAPSDACGPTVEGCHQDSVGEGTGEGFPMPGGGGAAGSSGTGGAGGATHAGGAGGGTTGGTTSTATSGGGGGVVASGVALDPLGHLTLVPKKQLTDYLWVADDTAYGVGLVSKIRTKPFKTGPKYREVARYATVTCRSDLARGSNEGTLGEQPGPGLCMAVDPGTRGCCSWDETSPGPKGGHQPVNLVANRPSRTAVDDNGDMWVANRGFERQGSVTKIAGAPERCVDRNGNGVIDTSSDLNGDGIITTDCDGNGRPDAGDTGCTNERPHEFFGLDDECVLFTVNIGDPGDIVRALALAPPKKASELGSQQIGSDAWVGTWRDGKFRRIHGDTGHIEETVQLGAHVGAHPYGAAIDRRGILWAPNFGERKLFYFDTRHPQRRGVVEADVGGGGFYGIAIDGYVLPGEKTARQQIWLGEWGGSGVYRYRPRRGLGFTGLGDGTWARARFEGDAALTQGRGVAVDDRSPQAFAWVALDGGAIGRVPVSLQDGIHTLPAAGHVFPTNQAGTLGVGIAGDLDVWAVNQGTSTVAHFALDASGTPKGAPDLVPLDDKPGEGPDFCPLGNCKPHPYTYSDFTGYGYATFAAATGWYAYTVKGCGAGQSTRWYAIAWDADEPKGASVSVSARAADAPGDLVDAELTGEYETSPADLAVPPGPLAANPAPYLEVVFTLSMTGSAAPTLKSFTVVFACEPP